MSKLIIQIPCLDEAATLPATLRDLPREVEGFDAVEVLVVDDGSEDDTCAVARAHGVDHVLRLPHHQGLARAFMAGLHEALRLGADVIVNTDADNQYRGADVSKLTRPIVAGRALIVVGARPIAKSPHFTASNKFLQRLGSWVVRVASKTTIADASSGFRAISREAALRLFIYTSYTYTLEMIIQASRRGMPVVSVPVEINPPTRPSRLVRSNTQYVLRSIVTIARLLILYRPLRFFMALAAVSGSVAMVIGLRYLYFFLSGGGAGHLQSLLASVVLSTVAVLFAVVGVLADLNAANRVLLEEIRYHQLRQTLELRSETTRE